MERFSIDRSRNFGISAIPRPLHPVMDFAIAMTLNLRKHRHLLFGARIDFVRPSAVVAVVLKRWIFTGEPSDVTQTSSPGASPSFAPWSSTMRSPKTPMIFAELVNGPTWVCCAVAVCETPRTKRTTARRMCRALRNRRAYVRPHVSAESRARKSESPGRARAVTPI